jgi:hypothetical protein
VGAKNWVIIFVIAGVALLTVGIVMSNIVEQERIPGSSSEYRRYTPFDFQGFVIAAIGGLIIMATIIATIIGNIGSGEDLVTATSARSRMHQCGQPFIEPSVHNTS